MGKIDISVLIFVYNQEKYLRQCLDSVLMQDFTGTMEVLVGEDCSTDGSRAIVEEYAAAYPDKIIPFLREKNMGATNNGYALDVAARGKYLASLDGDDFWIWPHKLTAQFEFMEQHPECSAVYGRHIAVNKDGKQIEDKEATLVYENYSEKYFERGILPGHSSTAFSRNIYLAGGEKYEAVIKSHSLCGDRTRVLLALQYGRIAFLQQTMSAYRKIRDPKEQNACSVMMRNNMNFEMWQYYNALGIYAEQNGIDVSMDFLKKCVYIHALNEAVKSQKTEVFRVAQKIINACGAKWEYRRFALRMIVELIVRKVTGKKTTAEMIYFGNVLTKGDEA